SSAVTRSAAITRSLATRSWCARRRRARMPTSRGTRARLPKSWKTSRWRETYAEGLNEEVWERTSVRESYAHRDALPQRCSRNPSQDWRCEMATVTLGGKDVELNGDLPKVGETAPDFTLVNTDLQDV